MALTPKLEPRPSLAPAMTPRLRQAIGLLQLSHLELSAYVERELERNPLLERVDGADASAAGGASALAGGDGRAGASALERAVADTVTLRDHLIGQLNIAVTDPVDRSVGRGLIDLIDEAGYFGDDLDAAAALIGCGRDRVEALLAVIQTFDPAGIGARDLAECLALQLRERDRLDPAMAACLDNLDLVARRDIGGLRRACGVDEDDVRDMLAELRGLDPKPGLAFDNVAAAPVVPDLFVRPRPGGGWRIELNAGAWPRVLVNRAYHADVAGRASDRAAASFLAERLEAANWLVRSLERRAQTVLAVAAELVARQEPFLRGGVAFLKPMTLKDIAEAVAMHESTISRATANKHLATPRGVYAMKSLFTAAIASSAGGEAHSAAAVHHRIRALIDGETPQSILSDAGIARLLRAQGVAVARRTVAKYREAMRIPASALRRRQKRDPGEAARRLPGNSISL